MNVGDLVGAILNHEKNSSESQSLFDSEAEEDMTLKIDEASSSDKNNILQKKKLKPQTQVKEKSGPSETLNENAVRVVVDQVTKNIASTIETLLVTDRVTLAEKNMSDWRNLCNILTANPELINSKISSKNHPQDALKIVGPDFENLTKVLKILVKKQTFPNWNIHNNSLGDPRAIFGLTDICSALEDYASL